MEPCPASMHTGNGTFRALAGSSAFSSWMDTIHWKASGRSISPPPLARQRQRIRP